MLLALAALALLAVAQDVKRADTFELVGDSGASAQQIILGTERKMLIIDKVQSEHAQVDGRPAWATEYNLDTNAYRTFPIETNSFCAGGGWLGDGRVINAGGNQAVTLGQVDASTGAFEPGGGAYRDYHGGRVVRHITPCDDDTCEWVEERDVLDFQRWYPTLETLEDGSVIIIGGELFGGFVNAPEEEQNVPSYEYYPKRGDSITMAFLEETQPANLYPLTWLMPDARLFIQAGWGTTLLDHVDNVETRLPDMPDAQRTYPASGAVAMLPLTKANNWTAEIIFCGGMDPERDDWDREWAIVETECSTSCVTIRPLDAEPAYVVTDPLPEPRGMGNFIILPDDRLLVINGAGFGSAGYGDEDWAIGESYADMPVQRPAYYTPSAPEYRRWRSGGIATSDIPRMYHSTASLLPDGSVFVAGSAPSADMIDLAVNTTGGYKFATEFRVERFYPDYFDAPKPEPKGMPERITYGGQPFDIELDAKDVDRVRMEHVTVVLNRPGFSTHAQNMGMRQVHLDFSWTCHSSGDCTLHVSQLAPNPAILAPGRALLFVVVQGVPSNGTLLSIGDGTIGAQTVLPASTLPDSKDDRFNGGGEGLLKDGAVPANADPRMAALIIVSMILAAVALPMVLT